MPRLSPQSLRLPTIVNVKPTVAWGNQSLKVSMCLVRCPDRAWRLPNSASVSRLDLEIPSPESGDLLDSRDRFLGQVHGTPDVITSGLVEPVGGFFSTENRPESPLHGQQVPVLDLPHRPPLDPFVLILFIHKLFKPRQEPPLTIFGRIVHVGFHLSDRTARQLTIPLFALFLSKPLLALGCQKQGEGSAASGFSQSFLTTV